MRKIKPLPYKSICASKFTVTSFRTLSTEKAHRKRCKLKIREHLIVDTQCTVIIISIIVINIIVIIVIIIIIIIITVINIIAFIIIIIIIILIININDNNSNNIILILF